MSACVQCCRYSGTRSHSGVHAGAPGCRGCPQQACSPAVCRLQFGARPSEYQLDSRRQDSAASQRHPPLPHRQRLALHKEGEEELRLRMSENWSPLPRDLSVIQSVFKHGTKRDRACRTGTVVCRYAATISSSQRLGEP